jgi:hypothetical protein
MAINRLAIINLKSARRRKNYFGIMEEWRRKARDVLGDLPVKRFLAV